MLLRGLGSILNEVNQAPNALESMRKEASESLEEMNELMKGKGEKEKGRKRGRGLSR